MIKHIFTGIVILSVCGNCFSQKYKQWGALQQGPYDIGFRVNHCVDYGRHVDVEDANMPKLKIIAPKQLTLFVWYPALGGGNVRHMLYHDYAILTKQITEPHQLTVQQERDADSIIKLIANNGVGVQLTGGEVKAIATTPVAAVKNAVPAAGKFPVILCGIQGGPSLNNVLFEYLASKGYVVVAGAGSKREGKMEAFNPQMALLERLGDMEYMAGFAHSLSFADTTRTGLMGVNFEGMTALLYQMKNQHAQAVVSLDGWEGKEGSLGDLTKFVCYNPSAMTVPYFSVMQDENPPPPGLTLTTAILDSLKNAERYYYVLNGMRHSYLVAGLYILPRLSEEKEAAYHFLYQSIGYFFDAFVKSSKDGLAYINRPAVDNGIPSTIVKTELKKPAI